MMDCSLYSIALSGNIQSLQEFVRDNETTALERVTVAEHNTALHLAARLGKVELVSYLLEIRPDLLNIVNKKGNTALHECAETGRNPEVVARVLVNHRPDPLYQRNNFGQTALFTASEAGHKGLVEHMLQDSSIIECQRTSDGRTCLHVALIKGHLDIANVLLDCRRDVAAKSDNCGTTALHLAASADHLDIAKRLIELEPDMCYGLDNKQRSPLHIAASAGKRQIVKEILSHKPDCIEILDENDRTALHLAVQKSRITIVNYLVKRAADIPEFVNKKDQDGNTALHLAMLQRSLQIKESLLRAPDIDVNAVNNEGLTPLRNAADYTPSYTRRLLQELVKAAMGRSRTTKKNEKRYQMKEVPWNVRLRKRYAESRIELLQRRARQERYAERHKEALQKVVETVIIVAILIATVAFSTAFNVPGGWKSDGTPVLIHATAFQVFIIFDALALFGALFGLLFWMTIIPYKPCDLLWISWTVYTTTGVAMISMRVAFMGAMYAVLARESKRVAGILNSIGGALGACCLALFLRSYPGFRLTARAVRRACCAVLFLPLTVRSYLVRTVHSGWKNGKKCRSEVYCRPRRCRACKSQAHWTPRQCR